MLTSPLLFAAGKLGSLAKQETTQVGGNSQGRSAWRGGPQSVSLRCSWRATLLSITCDDESHAALTCEESLERVERSLALSPDEGMLGTGLWVAKAGDG